MSGWRLESDDLSLVRIAGASGVINTNPQIASRREFSERFGLFALSQIGLTEMGTTGTAREPRCQTAATSGGTVSRWESTATRIEWGHSIHSALGGTQSVNRIFHM